jgi:uncharacterized phage-like protein YoqJ
MIIAGTGHRLKKLGYDDKIYFKMISITENFLREQKDISLVVSGMAQGWDQALAQACINLKIPFEAAMPFDNMEGAWPPEGCSRFRNILKFAKIETTVTPGKYLAWKMQKRNEYMVDKCDLLVALWDGSSGGTGNCIQYAQSKSRNIINLWEVFKPKS